MNPTSRLAFLGIAVAAVLCASRPSAIAGDERRLAMRNVNTGEFISIVYSRNGKVVPAALDRIDWFLRDWRKDSSTRMDVRLLDLVWDIHRLSGSRRPIQVHSGYRSPVTNRMLRKRSRGVSEHSLHMSGKAIDFHLPDVPVSRLRAIAMRMQDGGVGFYPSAAIPFVHVDVGSVRHWPRMNRRELARLFPEGGTAHVPSDGIPLPGGASAQDRPSLSLAASVENPNPFEAIAAVLRRANPSHDPRDVAPAPKVLPGTWSSTPRPPLDIPVRAAVGGRGAGAAGKSIPKARPTTSRSPMLAKRPVPRPPLMENSTISGTVAGEVGSGIFSSDFWNAATLWPPSVRGPSVDSAPVIDPPGAIIPGQAVGPPLSATEIVARVIDDNR